MTVYSTNQVVYGSQRNAWESNLKVLQDLTLKLNCGITHKKLLNMQRGKKGL